MRLWSIHPKYLDSKGLVALWREALLAKAVLEGKTRGYHNHPQLDRFKKQRNPVGCINSFLNQVYLESCRRNYCFDEKKIGKKSVVIISVTDGQLHYELEHFKKKLRRRDRKKLAELSGIDVPLANPALKVVSGDVESWEKV